MARKPGRPELPKHLKRAASTRADLTLEQKARLTAKAREAGMTEAELLRTFIDHGRVVVSGSRHADPALVSEVNRLALELKAIGVTANKMAVSVHTGRKFRLRWEHVATEIDGLRTQVSDVLGRLVGR